MSFAKNVFLVGMPGSGKSTVGKLLADKLGLDFYDLDAEIESAQQKSIAELFVDGGEDLFRKIESEALLKCTNSEQAFVMATGGGAPCFYNGISLMNDFGITVYLDTPIDLLVSRVGKKSHRPLLKSDHESTMRKLLVSRQGCYAQATYSLITAELSLDDKVAKIIEICAE